MDVHSWLESYGRAWREADSEAVGELFSDDAVYRSSVFRDAHVGREAIRAYWSSATSTQSDLELRFGRPFVDGDAPAVEWWAVMRDEGEWVTLPGCLLLRFDASGSCEELREYWQIEPGRHEPPSGWGR